MSERNWRQYAPDIKGVGIDETYRTIQGGDGCFMSGTGFELTGFINPADARLIAAAPDLLEAAKKVLFSIECYELLNMPKEKWTEYEEMMAPAWAELKLAIAKAEGKQ